MLHTHVFLEAPGTKSCMDTNGDSTNNAFNCAANAGNHGLTREKTNQDACTGECEAADCCGMCCYHFLFLLALCW